MNVTILLPTKQSEIAFQKLKGLLGPDDRLIAFDTPKFPARKLDEVLWKEVPNQNTLVIIMNPHTLDVEADFVEVFRMFHSSPNDVFVRSPLESFEEFYPEKNLNSIRPGDCVAFHRAIYKRQFTDISPHANFITCIKEIVRAIGKGTFYTPARSPLKLQEIYYKEEMKIIEDQQKKREILMGRLNEIREKRRLREEEKSRKVEQISRLQYELGQLEVEIRQNEAYLKQQEEEIRKLELAGIEEYKKKEAELVAIQEKIREQNNVIQDLKTKIENGSPIIVVENIRKKREVRHEELTAEQKKKKEQEELESLEFLRKKQKEKEEEMREQVKRSAARKREKSVRTDRSYLTENPQTRRIVLSEVPKTKEGLIGIQKIDWD